MWFLKQEQITVIQHFTTDDEESTEALLCAWCMREAGETPQEGESHGICSMHAGQMVAQAQERKAARGRR